VALRGRGWISYHKSQAVQRHANPIWDNVGRDWEPNVGVHGTEKKTDEGIVPLTQGFDILGRYTPGSVGKVSCCQNRHPLCERNSLLMPCAMQVSPENERSSNNLSCI
jgi:hypothetical protein